MAPDELNRYVSFPLMVTGEYSAVNEMLENLNPPYMVIDLRRADRTTINRYAQGLSTSYLQPTVYLLPYSAPLLYKYSANTFVDVQYLSDKSVNVRLTKSRHHAVHAV